MVSGTERDLVFSVLAFGYLGDSAKVSFKSIDNLRPSAIHVMVDKAGADWIDKEIRPVVSSRIVLHEPRESDLKRLSLANASSMTHYSDFGQERFIRLTTFKWDLIQRTLRDSKSSVFFSDLDVIWLSLPITDFEADNESVVWAQDDTPKKSNGNHYCTGIMLWKNTDYASQVLKHLFDLQCTRIISGQVIPDEPTFNLTVRNSNVLSMGTRSLNKETYVVGHRFFFSFFNFKVASIIAFHANYVKGEKEKYQRLEAIRRRSINDYSWMILYFKSLIGEVKKRIKTQTL